MKNRVMRNVLVFSLVLIAGCANKLPEKAVQAFDEGNFVQAIEFCTNWIEKSPDSAMPHFIMSVSYYFLGNFTKCSVHRSACLDTPHSIKEIREWLDTNKENIQNEWLKPFLEGIYAEAIKDNLKAFEWYTLSKERNPNNEYLYYNILSVKEDCVLDLKIPKNNPITFKGTMWLESERFLPVDPLVESNADFEITGGTLVSSFGDLIFNSTYGGWQYVVDGTSGNKVAWAVTFNKGKILTQSKPCFLPEENGNPRPLKIECVYQVNPFDFMGKYVMLDLDDNEECSFPLAIFSSNEKAEFLLGAEIHFNPDDYRNAKGYIGGHTLRSSITRASMAGKVTPYHDF